MRSRWQAALAAAAMLAALGGCATTYDADMKTKPAGDAYHKNLAIQYQKLAKEQYAKSDWADADHFAAKATAASKGAEVGPDEVSSRTLAPAVAAEASKHRATLVGLLQKGGAKKDGLLAADAVTSFDCWIENAEVTSTPERITQCRTKLLASMAALQSAMEEAPKPAAVKPKPTAWTVPFDSNSAAITYEGQLEINNAFAAASANAKSKLSVVGYTDRTGKHRRNMRLAARRAHAVAQTLEMLGVAKARISTKAMGEASPVENVKGPSAKNRRVEIHLVQ